MGVILKQTFKPMADFTLDDLSDFAKWEQEEWNALFNADDMVEEQEQLEKPGEEAVDRILAYNKALSVRFTDRQRPIQMILN